MPTTRLPAYIFDRRMFGGGRYRRLLPDGRLGALVSQRELEAGLREIALRAETTLADLAEDVLAGRLLPADFQQAGQYILKHLYNAYSALARGGWAQMDFAAWGANGQILRGEYRLLAKFSAELAQGEMSVAAARARAMLYVGKAYSRYWAEDRVLKLTSGAFTEERWEDTKGPQECVDCLALAALGWVPIGTFNTVPGAGGTKCGGACYCRIRYR